MWFCSLWDGATDLVSDVDMVNIGTPGATNAIADKSAVSVDGPDMDKVASSYAADGYTMPLQMSDPGFGFSTKRIGLETGNETNGAGNGITGDDETTEDTSVTWDTIYTAPDPGVCALLPSLPAIRINEVDADTDGSDLLEFVELYGAGNESLDGPGARLLLNGSNDMAYEAFDLDGFSLNADGFFVAGNTAVANVDLVFANGSLQNGADAVALYVGDAADFPGWHWFDGYRPYRRSGLRYRRRGRCGAACHTHPGPGSDQRA